MIANFIMFLRSLFANVIRDRKTFNIVTFIYYANFYFASEEIKNFNSFCSTISSKFRFVSSFLYTFFLFFFHRRQLTMHRVWKVATKDSGGYTESNLLEDHNTPCNRAPLFERNRDPSKLDERHVSSSSYRRRRNFNNGIPNL